MRELSAFSRYPSNVGQSPVYERYGTGTTVWSALASGILTGKVCQHPCRESRKLIPSSQYNDGIPDGSRLASGDKGLQNMVKSLQTPEGRDKIEKVKQLTKLAREGEFAVLYDY